MSLDHALQVAQATTFVFAVVGVAAIIYSRRALVGDERTLFSNAVEGCSSEVRARIAAAIERRRSEEKINPWPGYAAAVLLAAFCVLSFTNVFAAQTALGLQMITFVSATAAQLLSATRVTAARRLASMQARSMFDIVSPYFLILGPASAGFGAWFLWTHGRNIAAIACMVVAGTIAIAAAIAAAQTPAIVGDVDPGADELVDGKVRGSRIRQLLMVAAYAPLLLCFASPVHNDGDSMMRTLWMMSLTVSILISGRAVKVSRVDLEKMIGVN